MLLSEIAPENLEQADLPAQYPDLSFWEKVKIELR